MIGSVVVRVPWRLSPVAFAAFAAFAIFATFHNVIHHPLPITHYLSPITVFRTAVHLRPGVKSLLNHLAASFGGSLTT